ncbi:DUF6544 family protein [Nonomuraea ferruginea]
MRWRMLDALPVMSGSDHDISRSAAGRLASEFVLVPAAALDPRVRWKHVDRYEAVASMPVGDEDFDVRLAVDDDGRLVGVTVSRWGDPDGGGYRSAPVRGGMRAGGHLRRVHHPGVAARRLVAGHRAAGRRRVHPLHRRGRRLPLAAPARPAGGSGSLARLPQVVAQDVLVVHRPWIRRPVICCGMMRM